MKQSISVEIFREVTSPDVDVQIAHEGLAAVNAIAKNLEIIKDTRKLNLGGEAGAPLSRNIRWPFLQPDLAVILTNRPFGETELGPDYIKVGHSERLLHLDRAISIVNVNASNPVATVAHETGHMLGLTYANQEDSMHCELESCTMNAAIKESVGSLISSEIYNWFEEQGLRTPGHKNRYAKDGTEFCDPCQEQLARRSFFLLQHKQGKHIPESWR
jgi:hypothetical protein